MTEKLVNFRMDEEKYHNLKTLALKERRKVKQLISYLIEEYIKIHADGNPQYQIDQFNDPDFMACPAFYRDGNTWESYISKASDEEKQRLKNQIILLDKKLGMYL